MSLRSTLAAQSGYADETTPGTPATPVVFLPLVSESMTQERERLESEGIIAGRRVLTSDQWNGGPITVGGDVQHELYDRGLGTIFKHMFGGYSSGTCTPGDLSGTAFTVQIGKPGVGGTVHPFTYTGCKVASWELACAAGEIATLGLTVSAMKEWGHRAISDGVSTSGGTVITSATASFHESDIGSPISGTNIPTGASILSVTTNGGTAHIVGGTLTASGTALNMDIGVPLATASYTANQRPVKFHHGSVSIGGSTVKVKTITLSGDNGLDMERRFLGQKNIEEPLEAELRTYEGTIEMEFTDRTQYDRFVRGSEFAMVLTFTVAGSVVASITTNIRYDGETPQIGGKELLGINLPIKCVASGADSTAITAILTTP